MHIVLWSPAWPLEKFQNGVITYVHFMRPEFESQGHRVSVFTEQLDAGSRDRNVYLVKRPPRSIWRRLLSRIDKGNAEKNSVFEFYGPIASKLNELHRTHPIDVVEMEESFGWCAGVIENTSLPVVTKLHGPAFLSMTGEEINTHFGQEKIAREGRALRRCAVIASPSTLTLAQTIDRYSLAPRVARHVNNPVRMSEETPRWTLEKCDRKSILFVGRFDLRKGADVVLQAFSLALQSDPELRLIFVGPDRGIPRSDGSIMKFADYCEFSISPSARARIDYLGPLANQKIQELRLGALMTLVASRWENQGYTLLEAMYQGCPVISTNAGGCPENVADGHSGLLAKSEDPVDFAAKILQMLRDPTGAQRMGEAASRYVRQEHDVKKIAATSLRLYEEAIALNAP